MIHQGSNHIAASVQIRGQIHRLVIPVQVVALGRAHGHQMFIHKEFVAVVARHMHQVAGRNRRQDHILAEVIHAVVLRPGFRHADPAGGP